MNFNIPNILSVFGMIEIESLPSSVFVFLPIIARPMAGLGPFEATNGQTHRSATHTPGFVFSVISVTLWLIAFTKIDSNHLIPLGFSHIPCFRDQFFSLF